MNRNASPSFYEFFAGGGMARLGLGEAWTCAFANDFDPVKAATYRDNHADAADHFHEGDVWKIAPADLPGQADLAWASSPCQDFSLAGARAGLRGGRSSAFFGFWKLMEALAAEGRGPDTVVVENVVGLLTSHDGADFTALCRALAEQGYRFGALEIDAARFVPQSRPRVFVIATRKEPAAGMTCVEAIPPFHSKRVANAYEKMPSELRDKWVWWHLEYPPADNRNLDSILEPDDMVQWLSDEKTDALLTLFNRNNLEKISRAKARGERIVGTVFRRMRLEDGKKVQRAEIRFDGFAGCLRTPRGGSSQQFVAVVQDGTVRLRKLTAREAARLMGLGEEYKLPNSRTASLSVTGDGVVVDVVRFLRDNVLEKLAAS